MTKILNINPSTYKKHEIHSENRIWQETNCYTDLIVELLHSLKANPTPLLAFTLALDFEGEQWGFFKFPHFDIYEMYGIEIEEYAIWKKLWVHTESQVKLNRPVLVELDSYYLPDTAGTAYKLANVKTTVAVNEIDFEKKYLGYFHNQGYFELKDEDFDQIFQTNGLVHTRMLPPYVEILKYDQVKIESGCKEQLKKSLKQLKRHLERVPTVNPFKKFQLQFKLDYENLLTKDLSEFHLYSFANLRQYGANFELSATYLTWLKDNGIKNLDEAISAFTDIATMAKSFQFQLARAVSKKKELDLGPLETMALKWDMAQNVLKKISYE